MRADVSRSNRSAADKSTGHIRAKSVDKTKSYKEKSKPSFVSISQSIQSQILILILICFIRIKELRHLKLSEVVDSSTRNWKRPRPVATWSEPTKTSRLICLIRHTPSSSAIMTRQSVEGKLSQPWVKQIKRTSSSKQTYCLILARCAKQTWAVKMATSPYHRCQTQAIAPTNLP